MIQSMISALTVSFSLPYNQNLTTCIPGYSSSPSGLRVKIRIQCFQQSSYKLTLWPISHDVTCRSFLRSLHSVVIFFSVLTWYFKNRLGGNVQIKQRKKIKTKETTKNWHFYHPNLLVEELQNIYKIQYLLEPISLIDLFWDTGHDTPVDTEG